MADRPDHAETREPCPVCGGQRCDPDGGGPCGCCDGKGYVFVPDPPPGSDAARQAGCRCPVMDNCRGRGYMGLAGVYVYNADCPLHGYAEDCSE